MTERLKENNVPFLCYQTISIQDVQKYGLG